MIGNEHVLHAYIIIIHNHLLLMIHMKQNIHAVDPPNNKHKITVISFMFI